MKSKKTKNLSFEKKAMTELQKSENITVQGGKDTQHHDYTKYIKAFDDISPKK